ncbi:hypothetical protein KUD11_14720 [Roseovarius sp. LXJ103]|uniref:hypothetical protein n=1 Tax=Roseovarius carneus TaxID=2853164 RepID=UPI000D6058E9|nr:hypothetical protein [Roseovarius carneus]MBZ8119892.1 hypothetical protein [Roseovarius carneus]PWE34520.1 hypothetical protein DD563_00020 [Pelagicola sp. LXJ1103]
MDDKEAIDLLEKQLVALENAKLDMSMDRKFFYVGEYDLTLEGVYVAHKRHPGVLDPAEIQALVEDFNLDTAEFDR